jgi:hypothetical protein
MRRARHAKACGETADGQCAEAQTGEPEAQCCTGQDAMGHRITHQAHASQDQKYAKRRCAARQRQATEQRSAHEDELVKGLPKIGGSEHQATCVCGC